MATTTFAAGTVIASTWLNDVNDVVYGEAQHVAPLGTVSIPGYSFLGDLNNGWWSPAADVQAWSIAGAEVMRLVSTGLGIGVTPSSAALHVKSGLVNIVKAESTTARGSGGCVYSLLDPTGTKGYFGYGAANDKLHVYQGLNESTDFYTNATLQARLSATGDLTVVGAGLLGYGTGSGGTVTQATSKTTGVTLNKSNGQIVMNNAALGATSRASFLFTNSTIGATDVLNVSIAGGVASGVTYRCWVGATSAGAATIVLENYSGGSLSEAVQINFAVIKAVTA